MRPTEPPSDQDAQSADEGVSECREAEAAATFDRGFPVVKVSEGALPLTPEMVRRALDED